MWGASDGEKQVFGSARVISGWVDSSLDGGVLLAQEQDLSVAFLR